MYRAKVIEIEVMYYVIVTIHGMSRNDFYQVFVFVEIKETRTNVFICTDSDMVFNLIVLVEAITIEKVFETVVLVISVF